MSRITRLRWAMAGLLVGILGAYPSLGETASEPSLPEGIAQACGVPGTGDCLEPNGSPYCENAACCEAVCAVDPYCCLTEWDETCVSSTSDFPAECEYGTWIVLVSAFSQKSHGTAGEFDIDLPVNTYANAGIESRSGGPTQVVLTFSSPPHGISVHPSVGSVDAVRVEGSQLIVQLSDMPDANCGSLLVHGSPQMLGPELVYIRSLKGDARTDGVVNILDLAQIRNQLNQPVTGANFRVDVTADGAINILDLVAGRNNLNTSVTCPSSVGEIASVSSTTSDGAYGEASTINVTVVFSEPVTLWSGTLGVNLNTGAIVWITPFTLQASASGTYTVAADHNASTLDSTTIQLGLNAVLLNATGGPVLLDIPEGQSLADNKSLIIDTTPPTVTNVSVVNGLNVDVTFSEAMGSGVTTASNYTVSGSGRGTLSSAPNSVAAQSNSVYRLTWTAGRMSNGGSITITVANVKDPASNTIHPASNSGTDVGGAIGADMVLIPAGTFQMGDSFNEEHISERPVHSVYLDAFYVERYQVTKELWDTVRAWGLSNGYSDLFAGGGKAASHPVHTVNWFDCIKWCNARSEREGRTPYYYTDAGLTTVHRMSDSPPYVRWNANGYRLPTEAEWEKAARGGGAGRRFPHGNTINHDHANYRANGSWYSYDTSPYGTWTFHPSFEVGDQPYTSPVGYFAPNGYGLYDMAGNVFDWCNDWFDPNYYASSPSSNPRGPTTSTGFRVLRGASWSDTADYSRVANRRSGGHDPYQLRNEYGFRCAARVD